MKPKALVCALVAMSLTGAPAFAQQDNQANLDRNFQQIQRIQEYQARHGYQPPPGMRVYPAPVQPTYRQPSRPGYQQPSRPGYQQPGRPGYQQPGRPGYDSRRDGRNYREYGAGPDHNFHPGDRLPPQYRNHNYVVNDWRGHRLSPPPAGYQWVQTGADYVLIAIATGLIVQLLLSN
ncbi:MAG: RcnB family protein [Ramlibacter sp.]